MGSKRTDNSTAGTAPTQHLQRLQRLLTKPLDSLGTLREAIGVLIHLSEQFEGSLTAVLLLDLHEEFVVFKAITPPLEPHRRGRSAGSKKFAGIHEQAIARRHVFAKP